MPARANPFQYGRILREDELVDRQDELALLVKRLERGGRHFLIGPRRFGKSSLLNVAVAAATRGGTPSLLVNAESFTSPAAVAGGLVSAASALVAPTVRERILGIAEWFGALKPQVEYEALTDTIKVGIAPRDTELQARSIAEALDAIDGLAAARGSRIGVVVDEFQALHQMEGIAGERVLRAAVQTHEHLSYVFAGSHTRMLLAMITEHNRPFYRLGDSQYLGPVPRPEFAAFIREAFERRGQRIAGETCERICELSEDVPYNVQLLAAELWDATEDVAGEVTPPLIDGALSKLLARSHANYLALYLTLTTTQRKVIAGMARPGMLNGAPARMSRALGVAASTYRSARASFLNADLLHERFDADQTARRYAFVDPFFKRWLRGFVVR